MKIFTKKVRDKVSTVGYQVLKIDRIRNLYCRLRYFMLRNKIRILNSSQELVGKETLAHNMGALNNSAAFGMANRMTLLLYPLAAIFRDKKEAKVLIVGPRTEDDIFWARSLGMEAALGFDLFSYSSLVHVGDIHKTSFNDAEFDAVILGWVISYSNNPEQMINECKRIVKRRGYIAIGIESNPEHRRTGLFKSPRSNSLNSGAEISQISGLPIIFMHDPIEEFSTDNAVILQNTQC